MFFCFLVTYFIAWNQNENTHQGFVLYDKICLGGNDTSVRYAMSVVFPNNIVLVSSE